METDISSKTMIQKRGRYRGRKSERMYKQSDDPNPLPTWSFLIIQNTPRMVTKVKHAKGRWEEKGKEGRKRGTFLS